MQSWQRSPFDFIPRHDGPKILACFANIFANSAQQLAGIVSIFANSTLIFQGVAKELARVLSVLSRGAAQQANSDQEFQGNLSSLSIASKEQTRERPEQAIIFPEQATTAERLFPFAPSATTTANPPS